MHELLTGRSVKEIASRLDIEVTTVATYKRRLFEKLGATSILDLQRMVNDHA
jgi:DNA-binding NarL/FixJ family response regulator